MLPLKHILIKKKYFPSKKYQINLLDRVMYLVAFAGPVMTFPQIYDIWVTKVSRVNLVTWASYFAIGLLWLTYGVVHREKPIIFSNILGILTTGLVFTGAYFFR